MSRVRVKTTGNAVYLHHKANGIRNGGNGIMASGRDANGEFLLVDAGTRENRTTVGLIYCILGSCDLEATHSGGPTVSSAPLGTLIEPCPLPGLPGKCLARSG